MKAQGKKEGKDNAVKGGSSSGKQDKKKDEPPAPTPAKREDVVFDVTDKTLQKVGERLHLFLYRFRLRKGGGGRGSILSPLPRPLGDVAF